MNTSRQSLNDRLKKKKKSSGSDSDSSTTSNEQEESFTDGKKKSSMTKIITKIKKPFKRKKGAKSCPDGSFGSDSSEFSVSKTSENGNTTKKIDLPTPTKHVVILNKTNQNESENASCKIMCNTGTEYKIQMKNFISKLGNCECNSISDGQYLDLLLTLLNMYKKQYRHGNSYDLDQSFRKTFTINTVHAIVHKATLIFKNEPILLNIKIPNTDLIVLSDVHGSFMDLLEIFVKNGAPGVKTYLILGDYVDKGVDEVFVIIFLFLIKICFPERLYLLRGNHEFLDLNSRETFPSRCKKILGSFNGYRIINYAFEFLPLAAIVEDDILCVHGGVSQWMKNRQSISQLERPLKKNKDIISRLIISDIIWSDVKRDDYPKFEGLGFSTSKRGVGFAFNDYGLTTILRDLNVSRLIRGHQPCESGFKVDYDNLCYTVHARNFHDLSTTTGGYCYIKKSGTNLSTNKTNLIIEGKTYSLRYCIPTALDAAGFCQSLARQFKEFQNLDQFRVVDTNVKKDCQICMNRSLYLKVLTCKKRTYLIHNQIKLLIKKDREKNAGKLLYPIFSYNMEGKKKIPLERIPVFLDLLYTDPIRNKSLVAPFEQELINKYREDVKVMKGKDLTVASFPYNKLPLQKIYHTIDNELNYVNDIDDNSF
uniref:Serine/threonine-protein phosphatase n=1 Tax=Parastrongyloides trichosuri TaxID=131310 RepID=A0A0N4ZXA1_PARTI